MAVLLHPELCWHRLSEHCSEYMKLKVTVLIYGADVCRSRWEKPFWYISCCTVVPVLIYLFMWGRFGKSIWLMVIAFAHDTHYIWNTAVRLLIGKWFIKTFLVHPANETQDLALEFRKGSAGTQCLSINTLGMFDRISVVIMHSISMLHTIHPKYSHIRGVFLVLWLQSLNSHILNC